MIMTTKNLSQFAIANWDTYKTSIAIASKNERGQALVECEDDIYNFDEICKSIFNSNNISTSADGILFEGKNIELIEFKSGFKQRITKKAFNEEKGKCKKTTPEIICDDYWNLFWDNQERKIRELTDSIKLKAVESYITLEKHLFPICNDDIEGNSFRIIFTVVVDEDGADGIEEILAEASGSNPETNNQLISLKQSLRRFSNITDCKGNAYLFDEIRVLTAKDFQNRIKLSREI